ncbi:hypothetical protein EV421DRAFT_1196574 [Armillaria borealis]|uniref:Secreted protein n=1 Tax=Armillaria borealis TaxID=47425 RepID=A0AA39JXU6_9AGAR|nr:hypothetical protein EV421DRAFT_1196574 [Armillaria borealis]
MVETSLFLSCLCTTTSFYCCGSQYCPKNDLSNTICPHLPRVRNKPKFRIPFQEYDSFFLLNTNKRLYRTCLHHQREASVPLLSTTYNLNRRHALSAYQIDQHQSASSRRSLEQIQG